MDWEPFEPPGLFGGTHNPPAKIIRGALRDYDEDPRSFAEYLGVAQLDAVMAGKVYPVPRLEAWYGWKDYAFGGRVVIPRSINMPPDLMDVKQLVESYTKHRFDSCFVNLYRNEEDHIPWHADDDDWIGPVIASVSLGATRRFWLRRKDDHAAVVRGEMGHGDILLMEAGCQDHWEHSVPKEPWPRRARLNLTFRQTKGDR